VIHRARTTSGMLLLAAGVVILMGVITAEALYPRAYRTKDNPISDLGKTQPSAAVFSVTLVLAGLMIIIAGFFLYQGLGHRALSVLTGLLGVGTLGVGIFDGSTPAHPFFTVLAFLTGSLGAFASARVTPGPLRHFFTAFGIVAIIALLTLVLLVHRSPVDRLGEGGLERWAAYPLVFWLAAFGGHLATRVAEAPVEFLSVDDAP
jgi:hypothetical membrane protein